MSYCNNNPYNYPNAPAPRRTSYYDPYYCHQPPMMMPPPYYGTCPPQAPPYMHQPVYTPSIYPNGLQSSDPFSPPDYDKHLFDNHHNQDNCDNHTVESQHCDSIPIHPPECHEEQTQTQTQDNTCPTTTNNHHTHVDDDLSTVCSNHTYSSCSCITNVVDEEEKKEEEEPVVEDPPVQQDTFILRVPKNKKYRIRTVDNNHGHVHVNAYGQVLPKHPHL
jgi:hypothetical protein